MTVSSPGRKAPDRTLGYDDPIVRPVVPKRAPAGGSVAVMVGTAPDLSGLLKGFGVDPESAFPLFMSRLYGVKGAKTGLYVAGPLVGAPYAVMILETLVALGVKRILFFGWCGAVSPAVRIGDIVLPNEAAIDEGTSRHYPVPGYGGSRRARPSSGIQDALKSEMARRSLPFFEGPIWSTDGLFRETRRKTVQRRHKGILAVEMEASALFSAGRFHGIEVGGLMVVSDEISSLTWRPGFKDEGFREGRRRAGEVVQSVCQVL